MSLLTLRGIVKNFPGVKALDNVDFTLEPREIHCLMGENGAGKSTLIKVLTGAYRRDAGEILLDGKSIDPRSPKDAQDIGISTVYQEINLVPTLSVAENIYLGRQPRKFAAIDWRSMRRGATEALKKLNIDLDISLPLSSCSIAIQQMVAIARAIDISARVLVLDEPTSSLDAGEVARLFDLMRQLKAQGMGIVFVTHFLDQVYAVSDRITILRNGKLVGAYDAQKLPRLELIGKMIGQDPSKFDAPTETARQSLEVSQPFLRAEQLTRKRSIEPFDLKIAQGEIVGLAGLLGSGRSEIVRLLFGVDRADSGKIFIDDQPRKIKNPRFAIRLGLGFSPEDRKTQGIIPNLSVRENMILLLQSKAGWLRKLSRKRQNKIADEYIRALKIATPDADRAIKFLSGGNQQKVILARWLAARPRLLMLDEPTRGIDVGAKFEVADLIEKLRKDGLAIIFISSELEEVVRSCGRVIVLRDRRKIAELTGDQINLPNIMKTIAQ